MKLNILSFRRTQVVAQIVCAVLVLTCNLALAQTNMDLWAGYPGTQPHFENQMPNQIPNQMLGQIPNQMPLTHYPVFDQPELHQAPTRSMSVLPSKLFCGVDETSGIPGQTNWENSQLIPWETYAYGEYVGPARTPHVPEYRLRVDDQVEFVFQADRRRTAMEYRLTVGDTIRVVSAVDERLNESTIESGITVLGDGTISLDIIGSIVAAGKTLRGLQAELDQRYSRYFDSAPRINVSGIRTDTVRTDFLDSIDARAGTGGLARIANVTSDGTLRLPTIGAIGAVGLTLDELENEVNARFMQRLQGVRVSVVLARQAPRFLYILGEVQQPGRVELNGPTSLMQAIALAGGWRNGGNLRQIVVFRRDQNWRLMALKLDLRAGLLGKQPIPTDEIWLRDSDIVLIPKSPILRLADAIELYFTRSLYGIFPSQLGVFDAQAVQIQ